MKVLIQWLISIAISTGISALEIFVLAIFGSEIENSMRVIGIEDPDIQSLVLTPFIILFMIIPSGFVLTFLEEYYIDSPDIIPKPKVVKEILARINAWCKKPETGKAMDEIFRGLGIALLVAVAIPVVILLLLKETGNKEKKEEVKKDDNEEHWGRCDCGNYGKLKWKYIQPSPNIPSGKSFLMCERCYIGGWSVGYDRIGYTVYR